MIRAPTGINKYYGNMPILEYDKPFVPIEADMLLPDIFPVPSPTTTWLFLMVLRCMFARVTPIIHAVVGSIATNQTCTEMVKSRNSAPVIKCVAVRVSQELHGVLILQQEVVTAFPPMILAAQLFSLIGFSKEDFRASYGRAIWMTMIHFLSLKKLALK